jgi:hypothetical protein
VEGARRRVRVAPSQGVRGLIHGLPLARLLRLCRAVHLWSPLRVRPPAATPQPEQHPTNGGVRGDV